MQILDAMTYLLNSSSGSIPVETSDRSLTFDVVACI